MRPRHNKLAHSFLFIASVFTGSSAVAVEEWQFPAAERIVAVADIHGAYGAFETILKQAEVIDESLQWSGGATHLVIVGDVLDRGAGSRRALDLIMRLESESEMHGGGVHLVLGNHELMNLTGDLRYVSAGEYSAFANEELTDEREAALQRYLADAQGDLDESAARLEFDSAFPRGFFAHRAAFASDGLYGAWLLNRPLLVIIGDTAFAHGGLSEAVTELGGEGVNTELVQRIVDYVHGMESLMASGLLSAGDNFYDHPAVLSAFADRVAAGEASWPDRAEAVANSVMELNENLVFGSSGPAWYRGNVGCSPLIERDRLAAALDRLGVERIVIGHTPTPGARVLSHLDGAVMRVDTGMLNDYYGGRAAAWILEGSEVSVIYEGEETETVPTVQPRRVGARPSGLTAEDLEAFLLDAAVVASNEGEETALVRLSDGQRELEAVFIPAARRGLLPDVAAYRLDRILDLGMVPATVVRELDGELGSLQFSPGGVLTEPQRRERGLGGGAWCPLGDQFPAMYIFDSLIFNEGRTPDRIRYNLENFQLILVGHDRSLGTGRGRPAHLAEIPLELGPSWRAALGALTEELLTERLGDVLDRRRIRAVLQRRDALLEPSP